MKSYKLIFNDIIVEDNKIPSFNIHATKKDGQELNIKIVAIFTIENGKMVYCEEVTHLINGPDADRDISSQD